MTNRTPIDLGNRPFDRRRLCNETIDDLTRDRSSLSSELRDPSSLRIADGPAMAKPRADRYKLKKSIKKYGFVSPQTSSDGVENELLPAPSYLRECCSEGTWPDGAPRCSGRWLEIMGTFGGSPVSLGSGKSNGAPIAASSLGGQDRPACRRRQRISYRSQSTRSASA